MGGEKKKLIKRTKALQFRQRDQQQKEQFRKICAHLKMRPYYSALFSGTKGAWNHLKTTREQMTVFSTSHSEDDTQCFVQFLCSTKAQNAWWSKIKHIKGISLCLSGCFDLLQLQFPKIRACCLLYIEMSKPLLLLLYFLLEMLCCFSFVFSSRVFHAGCKAGGVYLFLLSGSSRAWGPSQSFHTHHPSLEVGSSALALFFF